MNAIEISVVMSVFNEQESLDKTMLSILNQQGVNFELIVVDDGSSDDTAKILAGYAAKDDRVIVLSQSNQGITQALVNGCKQAKGDLIARQDAGDWSLARRLKTQADIFNRYPDVVLCSTGARYFSERGELLFEASLSAEEARLGLEAKSLESLKGPSHHGCSMFRRDAYEKCGGYRTEFFVAQDLDLWTRLVSLGKHVAIADIYYEAILRKNAISSKQRERQEITRQHIFECCQLRKQIGNDTQHIGQLKQKVSQLLSNKTNSSLDYNYFVGSILLKPKPKQSRYYFKEVLKLKPWHFKCWIKLLSSYLLLPKRSDSGISF